MITTGDLEVLIQLCEKLSAALRVAIKRLEDRVVEEREN